MNNLISTYRFQFNSDFTFEQFEKHIDYLKKLGVKTIYASPVFEAMAGSTHGYDGLNPNRVNPELGTLEQLKSIAGTLNEHSLYWLQDIVPNHMAFHPENPWLWDILEKGRLSQYASFFDVAWNSRLFHGKLMVPVLADKLEKTLENGLIKLEITEHKIHLTYEGASFPLNAESIRFLLNNISVIENQLLADFLLQLETVLQEENPQAFSTKWNELVVQLGALLNHDPSRALLDRRITELTSSKEDFQRLLEYQSYALCYWKETEDQINFRRFFTINGLICINIQNPENFQIYHELVKKLLDEGVFQGVRVDHVDGLYNPSEYLKQLRETVGQAKTIVVEKILEEGEDLPGSWPIQGTTGYDFLADVNNLFTKKQSEQLFTTFYQELTADSRDITSLLLEKKEKILYEYMGGELQNLCHLFLELGLRPSDSNVQDSDLREVIARFLIHCPVYRYYGNQLPFTLEEHTALETIVSELHRTYPQLKTAIDLLGNVLLTKHHEEDADFTVRVLEFYQRCMQFTGPLMAKGGEDTLMYTYYRFIGHNEVGDSPVNFGITAGEFHQKMIHRQRNWPLSLNTTSTHDTKRGEDVRARLNVLTEFGSEWINKVTDWQKLNLTLRAECQAPDSNDEYMIYQSLIGAYPVGGTHDEVFVERIQKYVNKALREAKVYSTWENPDEAYEKGTAQFIRTILKKNSPFLDDFLPFWKKIAIDGIVNSLVQLALKFTCPGVPDVYQGGELWDLSLVDPDNRRPVDYEARKTFLQEIEEANPPLSVLWEQQENGKIKLWLTQRLFKLRQKYPDLFTEGEYNALEVQGTYKEHILAFSRTYKDTILVVIVPLQTAEMCEEQQKGIFNLDWKDTLIYLPQRVHSEWEFILEDKEAEFEHFLTPASLFNEFPVAILKGTRIKKERSAGLLLHVSSLPSRFGIGDMGPDAYVFVDFLKRSKQQIWQLLPLNPTEKAQGNSPYSALSSRAGNPLFISPELMVKDGLLRDSDLKSYELPNVGNVDYEKANRNKAELLAKAYVAFKANPRVEIERDFQQFCKENDEWLPDFALYTLLKEQHNGLPWYQWAHSFKIREENALTKIAESNAERIRQVKWIQYLFDKQWKSLRKYCNDQEIKIVGDIPLYVSHDSADVWSHRELFLVNAEGELTGVAGVPPDSFSETGQLWGMPVFDWEKLKSTGYSWWINRLKKNVELFDVVRLDHFRAFADYWVVSGRHATAEHGEWKSGPGMEFFQAVQRELGDLPFIAEDLGKISPALSRLKEELGLPGMKILQYAFDERMAESDFIPHNYSANCIVYTGTHDNNTTRGWYQEAVDEPTRLRMEAYFNQSVNEGIINMILARAAYSSVAKMAILPVQDILDLDGNSKMNLPGTNAGNWLWRLLPGQLTAIQEEMLRELAVLYGRD